MSKNKLNEDDWNFVRSSLEKLKEMSDLHREAYSGAMLMPESPLVEPFFIVQDILVSSLEKLVNDNDETILWWVIECDFGRSPMEAGLGDNSRLIKTVEDVRWLLEL